MLLQTQGNGLASVVVGTSRMDLFATPGTTSLNFSVKAPLALFSSTSWMIAAPDAWRISS